MGGGAETFELVAFLGYEVEECALPNRDEVQDRGAA
jgi:hypothetical protein